MSPFVLGQFTTPIMSGPVFGGQRTSILTSKPSLSRKRAMSPFPSRARQTLPSRLDLGTRVRSVRSEVNDLPLVHSDHRVRASAYQQSEMGERAKAAVSHQDIPELENRMKKLDICHFMSS